MSQICNSLFIKSGGPHSQISKASLFYFALTYPKTTCTGMYNTIVYMIMGLLQQIPHSLTKEWIQQLRFHITRLQSGSAWLQKQG